MDIAESIRRILEGSPGAAPLFEDLDVRWTQDLHPRQWAEYAPANEPGPPGKPNPFYGRNTISLNQQRIQDENNPAILDEIIMGDALHRLKELYPSEYRQFSSSASPGYLEDRRHQYERSKDNRSFDQWLDSSGHDQIIRGYMMRNQPLHQRDGWGRMFRLGGMPLSKQQTMTLMDLERMLQ